MADEEHTVRSVSWNEVFSFSHLFKSFKMAIHPSKIVLALLAITLTYTWGRLLDVVWTGASESNWVQKDEAWGYWKTESHAAFQKSKEAWLEGRVASMRMLADEPEEFAKADLSAAFAGLKKQYAQAYDKAKQKAVQDELDRKERLKELPKEDRPKEKKAAAEAKRQAEREALKQYANNCRSLRAIRGNRIFAALLSWEMRCVSNAVGSVRRGNIFSGLSNLYELRGSMTPEPYRGLAVTNKPEVDASTNVREGFGLLAWVAMMAWGLWWLFANYPMFSLFWFPVGLVIWSILGGAVCRIAALHAAREEKISIVSAVRFGASKFLSFLCAPLLPVVIIVILGLFLAGGGALGALPGFGEWFVAVLFGVALILGALIAFLSVGLMGGWPLMWPTIAVEGSDSFDAISRSFSYIFARPFRYGVYWIIAAVYGTVCYLFVRLFAFLALGATHCWAGWAMKLDDQPQYADGAGKLDVMWARPSFATFHGPMQYEAMGGSEAVAATIMAVWVYLVSAIVLAFLVTFFFSAATNIYYLLRQKVDATDLDDVYVEEAEEEEEPPAAPLAGTEEPPAEEDKPAGQAPPEATPPEEADDKKP